MKKYFVLGRKLSHSLSPFFQNRLFSEGGINAEYSLLEFEPESADEVFKKLREEAEGFNITVPYKQLCMGYIDEVTEEAQKADAVNTVVNENGRLTGYNTDGVGFLKAIGAVARSLEGREVLLLGAGGAARMIAIKLLECGARLSIHNRTFENALALYEILKNMPGGQRAQVVKKPFSGAFFIVNTTSAGMYPDVLSSPLEDEYFEGVEYAFDCVYNPLETVFLKKAAIAGAQCMNGIPMLWHQGLEAQRLWGNSFENNILDNVYNQLLKKAGEKT